ILAAGRLWWYWMDSGRAAEGYQYIRGLLNCTDDAVSPATRAEVLAGAGLLAWHLGGRNFDDARQLLEEAVAIQRTVDDNAVLARFVACLARPVRDQGDRTTARRLFEEALQLAEWSANQQSMARSYDGLGGVLHEQGDFERAITYFTLSLQV